MCGRFVLQNPEAIPERFRVVDFIETRIDPVPRFNIAPSQVVLVVVGGPLGPTVRPMRWGFRPAWARGVGKRPPPINARAESLLERPMFRDAIARHRCLIPADGFYEWAAVPGRKAKQPMHIRLKGGGLFGFAGLWTKGVDEPTCAIITTAANELMAPIHDRMPVILRPDDEDLWLDPEVTDPGAALLCLSPYSSAQMEAFPVSALVSSVRNDGPELVRPLPTP